MVGSIDISQLPVVAPSTDKATNQILLTDANGVPIARIALGDVDKVNPASTVANAVYDSLGDTDNLTFSDGKIISVLWNIKGEGPPSIYQFAEGADDGDYYVQGPPSGYLNFKGDKALLTLVLERDYGVGTEVMNAFNADNQGGGDNDIVAYYRNYLVKRHPSSLDIATFDSGGKIIAADDFDWHWFRRVHESKVEYMGRMFAATQPTGARRLIDIPSINIIPTAWNDIDLGFIPTDPVAKGWLSIVSTLCQYTIELPMRPNVTYHGPLLKAHDSYGTRYISQPGSTVLSIKSAVSDVDGGAAHLYSITHYNIS